MRLGFIGTGGITTAIVTGLCTLPASPEEIWVSPRNRDNAQLLAASYDGVRIGEDNQAVVDHCDVVFLAVLPQDKEAILSPLAFREEQVIVHLLAGTTIFEVSSLVAPAWRIVRAVPLPCTAIHTGPIAIYPDHETVSGIFDPLGTVIALEEEAHLETLAVITALMAPFYAFVAQVAGWGEEQGIDPEKSAAYTASMLGALSKIAQSADQGNVEALVNECMTPGGLNETAMKVIRDQGGFSHVRAALDVVKNR